jgi:hypothetical protein
MSLGDDQVFPCACGFDDVSFPHKCDAEAKQKHYLLGMTVNETLALLTRTNNELYELLATLQHRILALEMQVRCTHMFKNYDSHSECIHCGQCKGF